MNGALHQILFVAVMTLVVLLIMMIILVIHVARHWDNP